MQHESFIAHNAPFSKNYAYDFTSLIRKCQELLGTVIPPLLNVTLLILTTTVYHRILQNAVVSNRRRSLGTIDAAATAAKRDRSPKITKNPKVFGVRPQNLHTVKAAEPESIRQPAQRRRKKRQRPDFDVPVFRLSALARVIRTQAAKKKGRKIDVDPAFPPEIRGVSDADLASTSAESPPARRPCVHQFKKVG